MLSLTRSTLLRQTATRFSSTAAKPSLFLVVVPDQSDALARRAAVRPSHMTKAHELHAAGVIQYAGATLDENGGMAGSVLVMRGNSSEEIRSILDADIYCHGQVWDMTRLTITPFRQALPANEIIPSKPE